MTTLLQKKDQMEYYLLSSSGLGPGPGSRTISKLKKRTRAYIIIKMQEQQVRTKLILPIFNERFKNLTMPPSKQRILKDHEKEKDEMKNSLIYGFQFFTSEICYIYFVILYHCKLKNYDTMDMIFSDSNDDR